MISDEIKEALVEGLVGLFSDKISQIILYGSVARGDSGPDSDIDIAFVVESSLDAEEMKRFIHWNAEMDLKFNCVFSILDLEKDTFNKWETVVPFYKNIKKEGIVLWTAA